MKNQGHSQSADKSQLLAHETGEKAAGFKLHSEYAPTDDQPQAIAELVKGFFTMANVIQQLNKPTLVIAHNKTLAAQLYGEFKEFFPENAVEYFVSY